MSLSADLQTLADETDFSGVVIVSRAGVQDVAFARGFADREAKRPNTIETQFATASATKTFTALAVASLIESGQLEWDTPLRSLVGDALPLVGPAVTIQQLLGHTSGVGDYLDEDVITDIEAYDIGIPVERLSAPRDFLSLLDGLPHKTPPGTAFAYNNSGYVMLSLAIEAATGASYHDVVGERVFEPADMVDTGFFRSDDLPPRAALGYLSDGRTNVALLPVRGVGDGGAYTTVDDIERLWTALFAGRIVPMPTVERLVERRGTEPEDGRRYGLGFWLAADRPTVMLEGADAGVSFWSAYGRQSGMVSTVISNSTSGAWPLVRHLDE